jgi:pimeloyl-ACP methyl ester carboxylesterase
MVAENVLLLPGMMCDARLWQAQIDCLDIPVFVPRLDKFDNFPDMAGSVLRDAPESFAMAGLSLGGILAFEIWRQAPHRVSHLLLLDTSPFAETHKKQSLRLLQIDQVLAGGLRSIAVESLKPLYLAQASRHDEELLNTILDMALDLGPEVFRQQSLALANRVDSTVTLSGIDCPTTIICGREDSLCPVAYHEYMANRIPDSRLVVIDECGHLASMEQPTIITNELQRLFAREPHTGISHAIQSEKNPYNSRR